MKMKKDQDGDKYVETTKEEAEILSNVGHPKHWEYHARLKRLDSRCRGKPMSVTPEDSKRLANVKSPEELEKILNEMWEKNESK